MDSDFPKRDVTLDSLSRNHNPDTNSILSERKSISAAERKIYEIADRTPEVPYIILAITYAIYLKDGMKILHIFSSAFIFGALILIVGVLLKIIFKTKRSIQRYGDSILKYGFPSMHGMASIGALAFTYFINPVISLILTPIGIFYVYSRIKIRVHSIADVAGGAIIGIAIGIFSGTYILENVYLPYKMEATLTILFFTIPIISAVIRAKYMKL